MNKQLAKKGTTLNKNMTNTENLSLDTLEVTTKLTVPVYTDLEVPSNPSDGCIYIKKTLQMGVVVNCDIMFYVDGQWI